MHAGNVTAIGVTRRLQALRCLGWTIAQLADLTGLHPHTIRAASNPGHSVTAATANAIQQAYNTHWHTPPPVTTAEDLRALEQAQRHALLQGWAPAMAWDDIDDPDDTPEGVRPLHAPVEITAEEAVQLLQAGLSPYDVAGRMGVLPESLARRLRRHGQHRWAALCERQEA